MQRIYCCCLALIILSAPVSAEQQETHEVQALNEFLDADLATLLTFKIDPNLASILDSHVHHAGERMLAYHFMSMDMTGRHLTTEEVLDDFMVAPTSMTMEMHMVSGMYAPTDRLTLMVMLPYGIRSMEHVTRMGEVFTTRSSGMGDVGLMGNFVTRETGRDRFIFHFGLMLPTGSIDQRAVTPAGTNQKLPYPMQLGSGTYALMPGLMYQGVTDLWTWGTQLKSIVRLGKNSNDYRLGDQLSWSGWIGYSWTPTISNVLKLEGHRTDDIHGADPELNPVMVPTADPGRFGERSTDLHLVTEFYQMDGRFKGLRMSLELGLPVFESHDPAQLEADWSITATLQWTF